MLDTVTVFVDVWANIRVSTSVIVSLRVDVNMLDKVLNIRVVVSNVLVVVKVTGILVVTVKVS